MKFIRTLSPFFFSVQKSGTLQPIYQFPNRNYAYAHPQFFFPQKIRLKLIPHIPRYLKIDKKQKTTTSIARSRDAGVPLTLIPFAGLGPFKTKKIFLKLRKRTIRLNISKMYIFVRGGKSGENRYIKRSPRLPKIFV